MSLNLVTRDELTEFLDHPVLENDPDDQLIYAVSERASRFCGRLGWGPRQERTEYFDGGTRFLEVGYWPILSISGIYDDIEHEWTSVDLIDSDDYWIASGNDDQGLIWLEYTPTDWFKSIKIVYTGGYDSVSDIPDDLKRVALLQMRAESLQRTSASYNAEGMDWLPEVKKVLMKYRRLNPVA